MCSQEQWDIHKLDPGYECIFRAPPELPTITRRDAHTQSHVSQESQSDHSQSKRRVRVESASEGEEDSQRPSKRFRPTVEAEEHEVIDVDEDESSEEDAVEELIGQVIGFLTIVERQDA